MNIYCKIITNVWSKNRNSKKWRAPKVVHIDIQAYILTVKYIL